MHAELAECSFGLRVAVLHCVRACVMSSLEWIAGCGFDIPEERLPNQLRSFMEFDFHRSFNLYASHFDAAVWQRQLNQTCFPELPSKDLDTLTPPNNCDNLIPTTFNLNQSSV